MFYSHEFLLNTSAIVFTLATLNYSIKYMLEVAKETMGKGKSSKFKLKQQSIRTTSTLLWYLTLYKVTTFLVFVVAKI